jgi:hypothetical protein
MYIHDNLTGLYHDLKNSNFTISSGQYNKRFSPIVNKTLSVDTNNLEDGILIYYSNKSDFKHPK